MSPLILQIQLSVVEELGINLYSNTPAVLSELVANSWDADATKVTIKIDVTKGVIVIEDDGVGMSRDDLQTKYLNVGFRKRGLDGEIDLTPSGRPVMGRKGIGKLSVFAIAKKATVQTVKCNDSGQPVFKGGVVLEMEAIREAAKEQKPYTPRELSADEVIIEKGTRIILEDFTKKLTQTVRALRTRIARRFSVIGSENFFDVEINSEKVTPTDRDYFHRLQFVSWLGDGEKSLYQSSCKNLDPEGVISNDAISFKVAEEDGAVAKSVVATGWIGFARETNQMIDADGESLNRVILMIRGKLAQEDLLPLLSENRVGKSYLMGEIHADFLDDSSKPDIAVASRQGIKENDVRYHALLKALNERVKAIVSERDKRKEKKIENDLLKNEVVREWISTLDSKDKDFAKKMLKGVSKAQEIDVSTKETFVKHTIVAFEQLRFTNRLDELQFADEGRMDRLIEVFGDINRLEAAMYSEIVIGRIAAIDKLQELLDNNAKERAFQSLLADNTWLLDTSWERATAGDVIVERDIKKAWEEMQDADELKDGRVDIAYRIVSGEHLIIELKRSKRVISYSEAYDQIRKYTDAFKAAMKVQEKPNERCKVRLIVGEPLQGWKLDADLEARERRMFAQLDVEVCYYQKLAAAARLAYKKYLESQHKVNSLRSLLDRLDFSEPPVPLQQEVTLEQPVENS